MRHRTSFGAWLLLVLGAAWIVPVLLITGGGPGGPGPGRILVVALAAALVVTAWRLCSRRAALAVFALLCGVTLVWTRTVRPSNVRDWAPDLARVATVEIHGTSVSFQDVRNFRYRSRTDWDAAWYSATYDTRDLVRVWFVVEPFSSAWGAAHTMVSFEFSGDRFLVFSVEVRRERGETYSVFAGLFRRFELTYVVGDERDLIQLRSNHRRDEVYLYPVRADHDHAVAFFLDMVHRMNRLVVHPEFYNTLTNNCTTNLVRHLEQVSGEKIPYDHRTLLPAYSDELAFDLGILDTDVDLAATRARCRINDRALAAQDREDFSRRIRGHATGTD